MSRGLSAPNVTASTALHVRPIVFLSLGLDTGTLRLHNGVGNYTWGGFTWIGLGALGEVGDIDESDDGSAYRISYRLNGVDATILNEALNEDVFERVAIRYEGYLDDNGQLVADPDEVRRDYMDSMEISSGGEIDFVLLHCESELVRDRQPPGGMFTDEDQQALFSGDTGFQYLSQMIDATIFWGARAVALQPGVAPGPGGPGDRTRRPTR